MTKANILIVEDELILAKDIQGILNSLGYKVPAIVSSGEEAIKKASETCPDLVLMDIKLKGDMDGIEAAKLIKDQSNIPVIYLTAHADSVTLQRAKITDPFGYILKPFEKKDLRIGIEMALYKHQAGEQIRKLSRAVEYNPCTIVVTDTCGNIEYANPKFTQLTGYSIEEAVGKNPRILKSGKTPPEEYKRLWDTITSGNEWRGEFCNRKKNGELYWESASILPIKNTEGVITHFVAVKEDITGKKQMREMILQSKKLKSLGVTTSRIAHEFNNILAIISGNVQFLDETCKGNKELTDGLRTIRKVTNDGAEIVNRMCKFTKVEKNTTEFTSFDLGEIIKQAIDLTMSGGNNMIQSKGINYHVDEKCLNKVPTVRCNSSEMREVFANLINNAMDAMPDGGRISFLTWSKDDTIFVSISDTGKGMSEDVQEKIFDPFFTTRSPERTGLGMSIV